MIFSIQQTYAQSGLVITEIMAHPNEAGSLAAEYIELYNNSSATIQLAQIRLQVATNSLSLPSYLLGPRQYLILSSAQHASLLQRYGQVLALPTWRILNNQGAEIALIDQHDQQLDHVAYRRSWYGSSLKNNGGWSLERINPNVSCNNQSTWTASISAQGGTPGHQNSVWNERFTPEIAFHLIDVQPGSIRLHVENAAQSLHIPNAGHFRIQPGDQAIASFAIWNDTVLISLHTPLLADIPYDLQINAVDYCGYSYQKNIPLINASETAYNDLIINEILFNPKPGSVDFVEIFNRSDKTINLQGWQLGNRVITSQFHPVAPAEYRVFTIDEQAVYASYPRAVRANFIVMNQIPAYPNSQGTVVLRNANHQTIDSIFYTSGMHQAFLRDVQGISLERQSSLLDGNEAGNLTSASTLIGGATPGYVNSNHREEIAAKNSLQLVAKIFFNQRDGFEEQPLLRYAFTESNMMITVTIFNGNGQAINRLIRSKSVGYAGELYWNGQDENGRPCPGGIYLYHAEIISSKGHYQTFKDSFVLVDERKKY
ncbi:lamin tail domain-containing protein [Sphingobacterium oryzagri]|uniref:Lamin tail domain-containing protein n=1 Tax=Sphingobacterium oryzagri TaxID=3025669 RepID=A0ABY7WGZ1_9SPHI|nr:lamin tail domain-containing protein [Sphingobacterium sp. KACC 22765]WDF68899.1 lamin tail domain-containing protein [Sphingobacterium sp. KACC 22765]